ncbi:MAG: hypothetical protein JW722_01665 [Demequinaceae bacterium]|nr:hypothetical protein [Demequinaceae bacterium]
MSIRKLGMVAIAAVVALSLTGCFKTTAHYTLHQDDTVSGEIIVGLAKEFAEDLSPEEATDSVGGSETLEGIEDFEAKSYDDGKFIGTIYTFEDQPLDAIAANVDGTLVRDGDLFVFQGNPVDPAQFEGAEAFLDSAEASLSITFPGAITDTNGSVSGTTVTWNLLTLTEAPYATGGAIGSGDSGDGMPTWVYFAIAGGAIVLIGVIVMLSRRSKDEAVEAAPVEKKAPAKKPTDKK